MTSSGTGLVGGLYVERSSPVHRLAAEQKLVGTLVFVLAVVATPREAFWAFGVAAALVGAAVALARLPAGLVARRCTVEVPFLLFALAMPVLGTGARVDLLGLSLSQEGLWSAWAIVAKGTLGVAASVVLAATTRVPDLLGALRRLRVPVAFVAIAGFMVRYLDVLVGDLRRLQVARTSRGDDPRWLWQAGAMAATAGALFVRTYERGERVHQAMLARGFDGSFPAGGPVVTATPERGGARWPVALALPALAVLAMAVAHV